MGHQWWAAYAPALATVTAALMGGLLGSIIPMLVQQWKTKKAIKNVVCAQIKYTLRKAERFRDNKIEAAEFSAGKPLFSKLAETFGFLSTPQAAASSDALLLYFEVAKGGKSQRANEVVEACEEALKQFPKRLRGDTAKQPKATSKVDSPLVS